MFEQKAAGLEELERRLTEPAGAAPAPTPKGGAMRRFARTFAYGAAAAASLLAATAAIAPPVGDAGRRGDSSAGTSELVQQGAPAPEDAPLARGPPPAAAEAPRPPEVWVSERDRSVLSRVLAHGDRVLSDVTDRAEQWLERAQALHEVALVDDGAVTEAQELAQRAAEFEERGRQALQRARLHLQGPAAPAVAPDAAARQWIETERAARRLNVDLLASYEKYLEDVIRAHRPPSGASPAGDLGAVVFYNELSAVRKLQDLERGRLAQLDQTAAMFEELARLGEPPPPETILQEETEPGSREEERARALLRARAHLRSALGEQARNLETERRMREDWIQWAERMQEKGYEQGLRLAIPIEQALTAENAARQGLIQAQRGTLNARGEEVLSTEAALHRQILEHLKAQRETVRARIVVEEEAIELSRKGAAETGEPGVAAAIPLHEREIEKLQVKLDRIELEIDTVRARMELGLPVRPALVSAASTPGAGAVGDPLIGELLPQQEGVGLEKPPDPEAAQRRAQELHSLAAAKVENQAAALRADAAAKREWVDAQLTHLKRYRIRLSRDLRVEEGPLKEIWNDSNDLGNERLKAALGEGRPAEDPLKGVPPGLLRNGLAAARKALLEADLLEKKARFLVDDFRRNEQRQARGLPLLDPSVTLREPFRSGDPLSLEHMANLEAEKASPPRQYVRLPDGSQEDLTAGIRRDRLPRPLTFRRGDRYDEEVEYEKHDLRDAFGDPVDLPEKRSFVAPRWVLMHVPGRGEVPVLVTGPISEQTLKGGWYVTFQDGLSPSPWPVLGPAVLAPATGQGAPSEVLVLFPVFRVKMDGEFRETAVPEYAIPLRVPLGKVSRLLELLSKGDLTEEEWAELPQVPLPAREDGAVDGSGWVKVGEELPFDFVRNGVTIRYRLMAEQVPNLDRPGTHPELVFERVGAGKFVLPAAPILPTAALKAEELSRKWGLAELEEVRIAAVSPEAIGSHPELARFLGRSVSVGRLHLIVVPLKGVDRQQMVDLLVNDEFLLNPVSVMEFGSDGDLHLDAFHSLALDAGFKPLGRRPIEGTDFLGLLRQILINLAGVSPDRISVQDLSDLATIIYS